MASLSLPFLGPTDLPSAQNPGVARGQHGSPGSECGVRTVPACHACHLAPYLADISATLRALGVREHVLQQVHTEGVRPKLAARQATLGLGSVT